MRKFKDELGYVTFAQNGEVNYLRLAYIQALSLKTFMPDAKYAVIIDKETKKDFLPKYADAIDYCITMDVDYAKDQEWKFNNEWQLYALTPFRETIKLEADLVFTRDTSHWYAGLRSKEIFLTTRIVNYRNEIMDDMTYRRQFISNDLPRVYNGFSYFRYSQAMATFFNICKRITLDWDYVKTNILVGNVSQLTTDLMYAIAAKIVGVDNVIDPDLIYPKIVHMKGAINGLSSNADWTKHFYSQFENGKLLVGLTKQVYPFHYHVKDWATKEMEEHYERSRKRTI